LIFLRRQGGKERKQKTRPGEGERRICPARKERELRRKKKRESRPAEEKPGLGPVSHIPACREEGENRRAPGERGPSGKRKPRIFRHHGGKKEGRDDFPKNDPLRSGKKNQKAREGRKKSSSGDGSERQKGREPSCKKKGPKGQGQWPHGDHGAGSQWL